MTNKIDLSIIILNYNTKEYLKDCLLSIQKSDTDGFVYETIVVDNNSTDGSVEAILGYKDIKILRNKKNLGFAAGNNVGVKKSTGRYVLFLNPDTVLEKNTLKEMVKFMDNQRRAGVATCKLVLPSGKLDESCHRGFPTPWNALSHFSGLEKIFPRSKLFSGYLLGYLDKARTHQIDSACGAFMMVRRSAGETIGWWDESYFWYGEDLDFSYRIKEKGWQIFFVPSQKILHYKGAASGIKKHTQNISTANEQTKIRSIKSSTQVMRIFYQKHYLNKNPRLITWIVLRGIDLIEKIRLSRI